MEEERWRMSLQRLHMTDCLSIALSSRSDDTIHVFSAVACPI